VSTEKAKEWLDTANLDQLIKDKLKQNTDDAIKAGAFGAPTIIVTHNGKDEMFFGSDRFEHIAHLLGKEWCGYNPSSHKARL
jgi:glutathione S-transferase kappa 1